MTDENQKILIVDDDPMTRRLLYGMLGEKYDLREAASGEQALDVAGEWKPDLVLLDIMLPGVSGYEACRRMKTMLASSPPHIIMASSKSKVDEQLMAFECGADDYLVKPIDRAELNSRVRLHFRLRDAQKIVQGIEGQIKSHHAELARVTAARVRDVTAIQDVAVFTLARVAESRDNETGEHLVRMREYAQILAGELAAAGPYAQWIDQEFLDDLYRSSPLHDIGKVGISDAILLKPGRLTADEFEIMKRHTVIGANILDEAIMRAHCGGFLVMGAAIARFHHERWDGQGYPAGLVGDEIPLPARIVAVGDVFDALTSARPYKEAYSQEVAKDIIENEAGTQFDSVVVEAFKRRFQEFERVLRKHGDQQRTVVGANAFQEYDRAEYAI